MSVYLVTWDLNKEKTGYTVARTAFLKKLTSIEWIKDPGLDSVYFISTTSSINEVYDYLATALDTNDRILVTKLENGKYLGWVNKDVVAWIARHI